MARVSPSILDPIRSALLPVADVRTHGASPSLPVDDANGSDAQAAVAVVLLPRESDVDVLLIRRAERVGDVWSGHMAFPGGRRSRADEDLVATAVRETHEEVGVDLRASGAEILGRLVDVRAMGRGHALRMIVTPIVFSVRDEPAIATNHEVVEALWAPLGPMMHGEVDTTIDYAIADQRYTLPGYRVGERIVWGMTHRMLGHLFDAIRAVASESVG